MCETPQIGHAVAAGWSLALLSEGFDRTVRECSMVCSWSLYRNRHKCDKRQSGDLRRFPRRRQSPRSRLLRSIQKGWSLGIIENIQKVPSCSLTSAILNHNVRIEKIQEKKILANCIKM